MNIAALILALIGAGLSLFQPIIRYMNLNVSDFMSSGDSDLSYIGAGFMLIAYCAVACGIAAVMKKNKNFCAAGLAVCEEYSY